MWAATLMNGEFGFAGHRSGQVSGRTGVHAGVLRVRVQDHQGAFVVIIDEGVVTALWQQDVPLEFKALVLSESQRKAGTVKVFWSLLVNEEGVVSDIWMITGTKVA